MGLMVVGMGCAFSPTLAAFAATRFALALFLMASYVASFVYGKIFLALNACSICS